MEDYSTEMPKSWILGFGISALLVMSRQQRTTSVQVEKEEGLRRVVLGRAAISSPSRAVRYMAASLSPCKLQEYKG